MPLDPIPSRQSLLTRALSRLPAPWFALFAAVAAFACYFAMYAFRKPFTAASFEGMMFPGSVLSLKTAFVLSQIIGYTLSKYIGVKVCSETARHHRAILLLGLVLASQAALLLFAMLPAAWGTIAIFLSSLPLGMVWGLIVSYLEGRRCTDFVMIMLCGALIIAGAVTKDIGRWLMREWHVSEFWMPAATGGLFLPVFALAVYLLASLPEPDELDKASRAPRTPMDKTGRRSFLRRHAPGLILLLLFYFFLTAYRDFRDNYGVEIFRDLGYGAASSGLFTRTEIPAALGSLAALSLINIVRNHRVALMLSHGFMLSGMAILVAATIALDHRWLSGMGWMIFTGLGTYLAFAPMNTVLFERLMAATGSSGTAVFGIQLADSIGYTGSVVFQIHKDIGDQGETYLAYVAQFSRMLGTGGFFLVLMGGLYFLNRTRPAQAGPC